jgi:YidC/Oxa1 family membrane protein insertase
MDRKSFVILLVAIGLLMLWYPLVNRMFPPVPARTPVYDPTLTNTLPTESRSITPDPLPRQEPTLSAAPIQPLLIEPDAPEEQVILESDEALYTFTSHGGGLKLVELKGYDEVVGRQARRRGGSAMATLNAGAPVPAFTFIGDASIQGDGLYRLTRSGAGVLAEKELPNGLRIVKEFQLGTNYLLSATIRLENLTDQPLQLPEQELVIGTATPISPYDDAILMGLMWYNGAKAQTIGNSWFANRTLGCLPGTPRDIYMAGLTNVVWAAVHNRFFTMIAIPPAPEPATQVLSRRVDLPGPSPTELAADSKLVARPFGFQTAFLEPAFRLPPGEAVEHRYDLFAGPKEYKTLDRIGSRFGNQLDLVMGFTGFFGFFAKALLLSMNGLHATGLPYGLAIIGITVIIKLLFWPLTQISTRSMKRMQGLQPKMKEIQAKYKEDPKKMNQKMMEFMKENKVNPAAGCLPILIQIPVFIGFYKMLQSAIELRGATFLWARDLSQPDTIFVIPGIEFPLNPLPLIMGATQVWQMRLTPPSPGMDPVQQKMFQYMPLIFIFILYNFSSGLTLYWTVQNLLTIAQMKLTRAADPKPSGPKPAAPAPKPQLPSPKRKKA